MASLVTRLQWSFSKNHSSRSLQISMQVYHCPLLITFVSELKTCKSKSIMWAASHVRTFQTQKVRHSNVVDCRLETPLPEPKTSFNYILSNSFNLVVRAQKWGRPVLIENSIQIIQRHQIHCKRERISGSRRTDTARPLASQPTASKKFSWNLPGFPQHLVESLAWMVCQMVLL